MTLDEAVALLREAREVVEDVARTADGVFYTQQTPIQRQAKTLMITIDVAMAAHNAEPAEALLFSPNRCCPRCSSTRLVLDETTMLLSVPPQRPAECRDCGMRFAIPATGFLVAKPKAAPATDETERLRERVKQLVNRDRDAVKWRDRWRESNAEGLRLREALTEIAVGDHEGRTPEERAQAALDGDEE
jgi:hypothetical protein